MPRPVHNPPNPWLATDVDWEGEPPPAELHVYEERAKSAITTNKSPDIGFRHGLNPYRGCYHGCVYCYARPTHEYLGWGAGTDFERRIVVKTNIAEVLRDELTRKSWKGETIVFSGVTDCYQPLEASFRLTRKCLEVCAAFRNPVGIITKGAVIQRDTDVLAELAKVASVRVYVSIPLADNDMGRKFEPFASPIDKRFETLRKLAEAGIPVGVAVAPVIPGVSDSDIPRILSRAREMGATSAFMTLLRLPGSVADVFDVSLEAILPDRANKVRHALKEMRGGKVNNVEFGRRMRGEGERYGVIEALFETTARRLGLEVGEGDGPVVSTFQRPTKQLALF